MASMSFNKKRLVECDKIKAYFRKTFLFCSTFSSSYHVGNIIAYWLKYSNQISKDRNGCFVLKSELG